MGCGEEDKIIRICQCRYLGTVDGWDTRCLLCFSYEEVYCEAEQGHGKGAALFDPLVEPDGFGEGLLALVDGFCVLVQVFEKVEGGLVESHFP